MNGTVTPYYPAVLVARAINTIVAVIEFLFMIRILLELLAANAASPFVAWIYSVTGALEGPFAGAFPSLTFNTGSVLDITAILAMVGYAIIGWVIIRILWLLVP